MVQNTAAIKVLADKLEKKKNNYEGNSDEEELNKEDIDKNEFNFPIGNIETFNVFDEKLEADQKYRTLIVSY